MNSSICLRSEFYKYAACFKYIIYITTKNQDFGKVSAQTIGKSKEDSSKFRNEKINEWVKFAQSKYSAANTIK